MRKGSRTEYMYEKRVTYAAIATGIREGKIACHLEDGKVLIDFEEADEYFRRKRAAKLVDRIKRFEPSASRKTP
jgi:hypothetical protein